MEKLNKWQSIVMLAGACLMVVGAGLLVFGVFVHAPWIFLAGALAFACMQAQQAYHGTNLTIKRLRRIMLMGDLRIEFFKHSYHIFLIRYLFSFPMSGSEE